MSRVQAWVIIALIGIMLAGAAWMASGAGSRQAAARAARAGAEAAQAPSPPGGAPGAQPAVPRSRPLAGNLDEMIRQRQIHPQVARRLGGRAFAIERPPTLRIGKRDGEPALDHARRLLPAIEEGDAAAAYDLWLAFYDCNAVTSRNAGEGLELLAQRNYIDLQQELARRVRDAGACEGLLTDPALNAVDWLALAAEGGSIEAMLTYAGVPELALGSLGDILRHPDRPREYRQRSLRYLEAAVAAGNVDALRDLRDTWRQGVLVEPDLVRAYAYKLAADRAYPLGPVPQIPGLPPMPADPDETWTSKLSIEQRRSAEQLAESVYAECCS